MRSSALLMCVLVISWPSTCCSADTNSSSTSESSQNRTSIPTTIETAASTAPAISLPTAPPPKTNPPITAPPSETNPPTTAPPPAPPPGKTKKPKSKGIPGWAQAIVATTLTLTLCALVVLVLVVFGFNVPFYGRVGHIDMKVRYGSRVQSQGDETEGCNSNVTSEGGKAILSQTEPSATSVNPQFASEYECRQITEVDENRGTKQ